MTNEIHNASSLDDGAQPITPSPAPSPSSAPARDVAAVQADLLKLADQIEENREWWKREELLDKRGRLRQELDSLTPKKPLFDEKKLAAAEQQDAPAEEQQTAEGEGYKLEVPTDLNQEQQEIAQGYAQDIGLIAAEAGIPMEQAQDLMAYAFDQDLSGVEGVDGSNPTETISVLTNRYGKEAVDRLVADANAAVRRLGPSVRAWLETPDEVGRSLGNLPAVILTLAAHQRGDVRLSPADAQREITKLRQGKLYASGDPMTVDRVKLLSKVAARGQSTEMEMPATKKGAAPAPTSRERIEGQIKALRANPAYLDRESPSHAEVVAQVTDLYAQL
jgi:hypothetical protein